MRPNILVRVTTLVAQQPDNCSDLGFACEMYMLLHQYFLKQADNSQFSEF